MSYGNIRIQVMYNYYSLDYMYVIVAIVEAMSLKFDTTQSSVVSVLLMGAMWYNYVTLKYTIDTRCWD